jgi:hypothetical protein
VCGMLFSSLIRSSPCAGSATEWPMKRYVIASMKYGPCPAHAGSTTRRITERTASTSVPSTGSAARPQERVMAADDRVAAPPSVCLIQAVRRPVLARAQAGHFPKLLSHHPIGTQPRTKQSP